MLGQQPRERLFDLGRLEAIRARVTLVGDATLAVDDVEAVGPTRVSHFSGIIEVVDEGSELDTQLHHAHAGQVHALFEAFRARNLDLFLFIILVSPKVGRMSLFNVDNEKLRLIAIFLIQLVKRGNLPAKGRSGVAPEDQHDGLLAAK